MRGFRPVGWGYRKRKRLLPGVDLNIGRRGLGLSLGRRGARMSANTRGRKGVSLGWKGLFWRKRF